MQVPRRSDHQLIQIQPQAPAKPTMGAPCNGCGLCCLAEPCPLGSLLSLRRTGPCRVLQWDAGINQYRCGALGQSVQAAARAPITVHTVLRGLRHLRQRAVLRWIAAGAGCDCALEAGSAQGGDLPGTS